MDQTFCPISSVLCFPLHCCPLHKNLFWLKQSISLLCRMQKVSLQAPVLSRNLHNFPTLATTEKYISLSNCPKNYLRVKFVDMLMVLSQLWCAVKREPGQRRDKGRWRVDVNVRGFLPPQKHDSWTFPMFSELKMYMEPSWLENMNVIWGLSARCPATSCRMIIFCPTCLWRRPWCALLTWNWMSNYQSTTNRQWWEVIQNSVLFFSLKAH